MVTTTTIADDFSAMRNAEHRVYHSAAIGRRASRITLRCRPLGRTPHGFYQTAAFFESVKAFGEREAFHRETCRRLAERAAARGQGFRA